MSGPTSPARAVPSARRSSARARSTWRAVVPLATLAFLGAEVSPVSAGEPLALAAQVVIRRDEWGVPHVYGKTDAAVAFGSAWSQCEDHVWQLEDTYIQALGRYAEVVGEAGLQSDLEVALFDLVRASQRDYPNLPPEIRAIAEAFATGYNFWVERHPERPPRLLHRMEPWHVLLYERFTILGRLIGAAHVPRRRELPALLAADGADRSSVAAGADVVAPAPAGGDAPRRDLRTGPAATPRSPSVHEQTGVVDFDGLLAEEASSIGSNQWAVGPSRTRDGSTMLFINPHQPWYGWGMFTEMHVRSDEGWSFSGAMYPGAPFPTAGFNERLGWAYTVNEADVADLYRVTFDRSDDPLLYRWDGGWRRAEEWTVTLSVRTPAGLEPRRFTLRRTHHGPLMAREDDYRWLAVRVPMRAISALADGAAVEQGHTPTRMAQALAQAKARNFAEWRAAVSRLDLPTLNTMYADADGNIFYLYNGAIPRRDPSVDWTQPVDGSDPRFEWKGFHTLDELPQVLNPPSGYVQNCNSSPFTTTDDGSPSPLDFPPYMAEDRWDDKRRAKVSRWLLRQAQDLTFDDWQALAYDTTLYWPMTEIPRYARWLERWAATRPEVAAARPYLEHLLEWDYRATLDSTQATLAVEWYEELYGRGYPVETLRPEYVEDISARFAALTRAAERLERLHGSWKVPYGQIYRIQRHAEQANASQVPFDDALSSLPTAGVRGPLGVAFTLYHTPPVEADPADDGEQRRAMATTADGTAAPPSTAGPNRLAPRKLRYGTTGASYMAVYEFSKTGVEAASYLHYGQSHDPQSPHFFDQAKLLSERRFKPAWFHWEDVLAHTVRAYRPGDESVATPPSATAVGER